MAITVEARTSLVELVVGMFGAAPGASVLSDLVAAYEAGATLKQIAANLANTNEFKGIFPTFLTNAEFATKVVDQLVGTEVVAAEKAAAVTTLTGMLNAGASRSSVFVDAIAAVNAITSTNTAWANAGAAFDNKVAAAVYYSVDKQLSGSTLAGLQAIVSTVTSSAATLTASKASSDGTSTAGQTFQLTTGANTFTGGAGDDTFQAFEATGAAATWTVGDSVTGGAGNDILDVILTGNITVPLSSTVTGVETLKATSGGTVTINSTTFTGLTSLQATGVGTVTLTGAATTNVTGTVTTVGVATNSVAVNGGKDVALTISGTTADDDALTAGGADAEIRVGATTAAAGTVTVSSSFTGAGGTDAADIYVKGGTTVSITQSLGNAVNTTTTHGAVEVLGTAATTAVTVNQDKAATAAATVVGKVNGAVTIADANATSATAAGSIATVSLNSYGTSSIDSSAIATVNLAGTGGALTISRGALTAVPTANTLTLNLNGLSGAGASITDGEAAGDDGFTTVAINATGADSTVADLVVADATTITVAGDKKATFTTNTGFGSVTSITVTNSAGASFGTALGTGVTFTGGAGADTITLSNAFTKAITMGAGDDTVTYAGAAGTGGSVAAGDGTDTIVMTAAQADAADADATFNTKFTGFEVLDVATGAGATTINLAGVNAVNNVVTRGAVGALQLDGFTSGGKLTLDAAVGGGGSYVANVTNAVLTPSDTFNLALSNAGAATVAFGSVTLAGIETVNISTVDAGTASAASIDTATLVATAAKTVVVTGNNGLTLTNTGNTAITSFDASGVVGNSTATAVDTAANLAVTFTSANVTTTATVTITGGAGNDVLTGAAAKDTINGGAGNDAVAGGTGIDNITVGVGRDAVVIGSLAGTSTDSGTAAFDVVTGFKVAEAITAATDLSSRANFMASSAGGANMSILELDLDTAGPVDLGINVEANATALVGQAIGVTYTVTNGKLTLGGTGASTVDTLGEWLTEAAAVAATAGDILVFEFGGDSYVYAENGTADVLVQLVGVTGATGLVEAGAATTAAAGRILFLDIA